MIQGPGENAGVIDIGDGDAAIFKMESHNHPSFIEPYQGAATGVGGIMRDVFTMGARPIAMMNALRFGEPDHPKTRHLVSGVVSAASAVTATAWACRPWAAKSISTKATTATSWSTPCAWAWRGRTSIFLSAAKGAGNPVVYIGSKTGRDGIHGATMASGRIRRCVEKKAPHRAGRRSLHRKAAAGSLPGTDGDRRHHRHPGHGRGGPHLVLRRNGRQGRQRASNSTSTRCPSAKPT